MSYNHNAGTGTSGHRPVTPERYDSHDGDSTMASSAYEELQMRHQLRKQQQQQQAVAVAAAAQQQQQAQAHRKRRQGESPTSVGSAEDMDLLASVERFGELILSSCGMEDCIGPGVAGNGAPPAGRRPPRPASPTLSLGSRGSVSLNSNYSPDLFAGGSPPSSPRGYSRYARPRTGGATSRRSSSPLSSVVHCKAFPPLGNTVSVAERFDNGTAQDVVSAFFLDRAFRSMDRFHLERGDDAVRFGRWTRLPTEEYRLDRARSDVSTAKPTTASGFVGGGGVGHRPAPSAVTASMAATASLLDADSGGNPTTARPAAGTGGTNLPSKTSVVGVGGGPSLSLVGDVPPFLLSRPAMERHGTFRTPVRVPASGMSVTEVSIVQRLFGLSDKKKTQRSGKSNDDTTYILESVLRLLDVPYSDRFRVVMRQTISTEHWTTVAAEPTIDECLACSIPLMGGMTSRPSAAASSGRSSPLSSSMSGTKMSSANVRLEFEIQFHRTCMYEDRIRRMLTKKINKLMLSWCLWAQDGWAEDQRAASVAALGGTTPARMCMGIPLSSIPVGACSRLASACGDADTNSVVSGGGGGGVSPANARGVPRVKKWQSLSKRNDSFLLWSMTDIDEQDDEDDIVIEDEGSLASDMSNVGLHRLEWRNRSLTGKEHVSSVAFTTDNYAGSPAGTDTTQLSPTTEGDANDNDRSSHRGHGIELCLSDDEDYTPTLPPLSPRRNGTIPTSISNGLSPHGVEVVYVSDGTIDSPVAPRSRKTDATSKVVPKVPDIGEIGCPDLQRIASAAAAPPLGKPRHKGGFHRRRFGRKKPKMLDNEVPLED